MKKIVVTFLLLILVCNLTYAGNIIDVFYSSEVLKTSEITEDIIPFIMSSADRMIIDKSIDSSGILFSAKNILNESDLEGMHLIFSGETVTVDGSVENTLILAPNVIINGNVKRDSIIVSSNIVFSEDSNATGDVICLGTSVDLRGDFNNNVIALCSELEVSGTIKGDLRTEVNYLKVTDAAKVEGQVIINTENTKITKENSFVNAKIDYIEREDSKAETNYTLELINIIISSLLFGLIFMLFNSKTKFIDNTYNKIKKHNVFFIISGFLSVFVAIIATFVLLFISLFGLYVITMPIIVLNTVFMILFMSYGSLTVGSLITKYAEEKGYVIKGGFGNYLTSVIIFAVVQLLCLIPIIGGYVSIALALLSLGIYCILLFKHNK